MRKITLLHADGDLAAVAGDINAGERVVTDGQLRLAPGVRVKARETGPTNADTLATPANK